MWDTAQQRERDAILRGELKVGDTVCTKGDPGFRMTITKIEGIAGDKCALCHQNGTLGNVWLRVKSLEIFKEIVE